MEQSNIEKGFRKNYTGYLHPIVLDNYIKFVEHIEENRAMFPVDFYPLLTWGFPEPLDGNSLECQLVIGIKSEDDENKMIIKRVKCIFEQDSEINSANLKQLYKIILSLSKE